MLPINPGRLGDASLPETGRWLATGRGISPRCPRGVGFVRYLTRCYPSTPDASEMRPYLKRGAGSPQVGASLRDARAGWLRQVLDALLPINPGRLGDASLPETGRWLVTGRGISPRCPRGLASSGYLTRCYPSTPDASEMRPYLKRGAGSSQVGASLRDARAGWLRQVIDARCYPSTPDASEMRPYLLTSDLRDLVTG